MGGRYSGESTWRRYRDLYAVPAPAAGADWSVTIPASEVWSIDAIYAELVTSAAVANRTPSLVLSADALTICRIPALSAQAASLTGRYSWLDLGVGYATGQIDCMPLPRLQLEAGSTISSSTALIDAADQWGSIALYVVRTVIQRGAVDLSTIPDLTVTVLEAPVS